MSHVPWSAPTSCPVCAGECRSRLVEGEEEFDPIRIDPADVEEALRVAEGFVSFTREGVEALDALEDEQASSLVADAKRLLKLWDGFKDIAQTRVERAREVALDPPTASTEGDQ